MFDNLVYNKYIYSTNINIRDIENMREINKLKFILIEKTNELKILQKKYNKLLNNCIKYELNKKKDINNLDFNIDNNEYEEEYEKI